MLFNVDLTADNPAGHWHGLSSPDPTNREGASSGCPTILNMISQTFISTKPPSSREVRSDGARSNVVSPCVSSSHLSIDEREDEREDEPEAIEPPQASDSAQIKPPEKRTTRTKTSFQLAHPPRNARHERLRIRPKLLLQLQQISRTARPIPTLDVVPSAVFAPKLAKKFPSMFRGKDRVGPNDLVVVTSESYRQPRSEEDEISFSSEDDPNGNREMVATICPARREEARMKGKAEICLNRGLTWEATLLPNGSYDFVAFDENGLQTTVRWAWRSKNNRRASSGASSIPSSTDEGKRFTFSIMDPTTRRHPVIASMTKKSIDVLDRYPVSPPTNNTGNPASNLRQSSISPEGSMTGPSDPLAVMVETDDNLRALIVVTGIWVAFREGWANLSSLQPPGSPVASRTPIAPIPDHEKEDQLSVPAREAPRSSFHSVRTKLRHKSQPPAPTESPMLSVPETQPTQNNPNTQPGRLTISTTDHTDLGTSQPNTPYVSSPVSRYANAPESSRNLIDEKKDRRDSSLWKNDDYSDTGSRDNRSRANTHPPGAEKSKEKKRWRRFSSMLDSMGRKEKSGHVT